MYKSWGEQRLHYERIFENWLFEWKKTRANWPDLFFYYKSWGEQRLHFERIFENWLFCMKIDKLYQNLPGEPSAAAGATRGATVQYGFTKLLSKNPSR